MNDGIGNGKVGKAVNPFGEQQLYVVTMYRNGDPEAHSYVAGVFTTKQKAKDAIADEEDWRGGKYEGAWRALVLDKLYDREADIRAAAEHIRAALSSADAAKGDK